MARVPRRAEGGWWRSPRSACRRARGEGGASDGRAVARRRGGGDGHRPSCSRNAGGARRPAEAWAGRRRGGFASPRRCSPTSTPEVAPSRTDKALVEAQSATRRVQRDGVASSRAQLRDARGGERGGATARVRARSWRLARRAASGAGTAPKTPSPPTVRRTTSRAAVRADSCVCSATAVPPPRVRQPRDQLLVRQLRVRVARQCTTARRASTRVSSSSRDRVPTPCAGEVSVGSMMMKHLDVCPFGEVARDAPDAEEDPDDLGARAMRPRLCRRDLARHRKEECEFARVAVSPMSRARLLEARRRTRRHGGRRANRVRGTAARRSPSRKSKRTCGNDARGSSSIARSKTWGATRTAERGSMDSHLRLAAGATSILPRVCWRRGRRRRQPTSRRGVARRSLSRARVEERRAESPAALRREGELGAERPGRRARERDGETRARLAREVETLKQAMADQTADGAQLLETFNDAAIFGWRLTRSERKRNASCRSGARRGGRE